MKWNIKSFILDNKEKDITLKAYLYSYFYFILVTFVPMYRMEKMMGERGKEDQEVLDEKAARICSLIRFHVNRITEHTPWKRKCYVRALAAQKLLNEKGLKTTLYLGVGKEDGVMVAHAWLKCGDFYVTGGDGTGYAVVAKFCK